LFRETLKILGEENRYAQQIDELRRGALAITEAVLYIKQHSINCISAAMYAMTRFDPCLFPPGEAERFASDLFIRERIPNKEDGVAIREHIISLYRRFLAGGDGDWTKPLLEFLKEMRQKLPTGDPLPA
jgi:hypothetical protein